MPTVKPLIQYPDGVEEIRSGDTLPGGSGSGLPPGGVADQILRKTSSVDGDATWGPKLTSGATLPASPAEGDIHLLTGVPATAGGIVDSVVAGAGISVNSTDPENPVVSAAVTSVAGKTGAVTLTPSDAGAAPASHTHSASDITSGTMAPARLGTGTPDATKVLYGDGAWKNAPSGGGGITSVRDGLGIAVDSTDPQNPIVSATFVPTDVAPQGHMDADYPSGNVYLYLKPSVVPISYVNSGAVASVYVPDGGSSMNYRTHYIVQVFNNLGVMVTPDSITVAHMSVTVDMTSFGNYDTHYVVVL